MTYFRQLELAKWQQYDSVELRFHDRLTILTGANASGKTTILNLLARHIGWDVPSLALPRRSGASGVVQFFVGLFRGEERGAPRIGSLTYGSGKVAELRVPTTTAASYNVEIHGQQNVPCFFLPSHRSVYRYQAISQIPSSRLGREQAYDRVWGSTRSRYFGGGDYPASYHMKEILVHWSIFGRGNEDIVPDDGLRSLFTGFQDVLRALLPESLGFRRISIRSSEIVLETKSGDFMIDAVSGGLSSLIDLAWQVFLFPHADADGFTVLIDEVENHLHPTMQRRVLGDLLTAFPKVRFIITTHSPLVVNSVRDSAVYALRHRENSTVKSERLDLVRQARTATQILNEVLGVSTTMPIWAERELDALVSEFLERSTFDESSFRALRKRMEEMGLASHLPEALGRVVEREGR